MQDDAAYHRMRAQEEIGAAMEADSTAARKAHLELAQRYADLADAMDNADSEEGVRPARPTASNA